MKKNIFFLVALAVLSAALTACKTDLLESVTAQEEMSTTMFSIGETIITEEPAPAGLETRTVFSTPSGTSYPVLWTANEGANVYYIGKNFSGEATYSVAPSSDGKTAKLKGKNLSLDGKKSILFYLVSPSSAVTSSFGLSVSERKIGIELPPAQTPGAQSPDEKAQLLGAGTALYETPPAKVEFTPKHLTAYIKLTLTNAYYLEPIKSVTLTAEKPLSGAGYVDLAAMTLSPAVSDYSYSVTAVTDGKADIWFACFPAQIEGTTLKIRVTGEKHSMTREITVPSGKNLTAGKIASLDVNMHQSKIVKAVDLGLSVKWADVNIFASAPEEVGEYFQWGYPGPVEEFSWSTYAWCKGSNSTLTRYVTNGAYGTVDNITTMRTGDDAATAWLLGKWRTPTQKEAQELLDNCSVEEVTQNGVAGYKVTGKTGNSIFLPKSGMMMGTSKNLPNYAEFWVRDLTRYEFCYQGTALYFNGSNHGIVAPNRCNGLPVRAVDGSDDIYVEAITLDKKEMTLRVGETGKFTATVSPSNATIPNVEWYSGTASVATVDYLGNVTALAPGTSDIRASDYTGNIRVWGTVKVIE